jgi:positive regulator of sigma E activity
MSSFATYLIGFIILIVGLALAAFYLNAPTIWIAIGVVILLGIGVLMATRHEKPRDPPKA